jgi:hypothetical protein
MRDANASNLNDIVLTFTAMMRMTTIIISIHHVDGLATTSSIHLATERHVATRTPTTTTPLTPVPRIADSSDTQATTTTRPPAKAIRAVTAVNASSIRAANVINQQTPIISATLDIHYATSWTKQTQQASTPTNNNTLTIKRVHNANQTSPPMRSTTTTTAAASTRHYAPVLRPMFRRPGRLPLLRPHPPPPLQPRPIIHSNSHNLAPHRSAKRFGQTNSANRNRRPITNA